MHKYYFEKLDVWRKSNELSKQVYRLTQKLRTQDRYEIGSQIRRSAISISANIAEGVSRLSNKDKARFINLAYSSSWETLSHLILLYELELIKENEYLETRMKIELITRQLNSLHSTIKSKI